MVPTLGMLSTAIEPPFISMLRFAIAMPRPVPLTLVEKYGSKIRRRVSASKPTPLS